MRFDSDFKKFFFTKILGRRNFTYRVILSVLERYLKKQYVVLDAGCGEGNLSLFIANRGNNVTGVDISMESIEICKEKARKLGLKMKTRFVKGDIRKYKLDNRFDFIICIEVLEHVKDGALLLGRFSRLLNPSGIIILSTPSRNAPLFRLKLTERQDKLSGHLKRYTCEELVCLLKNKGLKILETRKAEGILRNFLFYNRMGIIPLKLANRFTFVSDLLTFLDNITLKLFGESQIIVVAQKPANKNK